MPRKKYEYCCLENSQNKYGKCNLGQNYPCIGTYGTELTVHMYCKNHVPVFIEEHLLVDKNEKNSLVRRIFLLIMLFVIPMYFIDISTIRFVISYIQEIMQVVIFDNLITKFVFETFTLSFSIIVQITVLFLIFYKFLGPKLKVQLIKENFKKITGETLVKKI